jgi:hypothetical protein
LDTVLIYMHLCSIFSTYYPDICLNIFLCLLGLLSRCFLKRCPHPNCVFLDYPILTTCPANHSLLHFIVLTLLGGLCKPQIFSLCDILCWLFMSLSAKTNIFVSPLFLTLVVDENFVCGDGTPCSLIDRYRCFGGTWCLHFQGSRCLYESFLFPIPICCDRKRDHLFSFFYDVPVKIFWVLRGLF